MDKFSSLRTDAVGAYAPDHRDQLLQTMCPVLAAPRFGELPPMDAGQRVIVASNGVFVQFKRNWLECTRRVGLVDPHMRLSYGAMAESTTFSFGAIPQHLMRGFLDHARASLPNEAAGALVCDREGASLRLVLHQSDMATCDQIAYRVAPLMPGEDIVIDIHSHGHMRAFFSPTDDQDDIGTKVAVVFGNLDDDLPSAAVRLCLNGLFVRLPDPWSARRAAQKLFRTPA